jgi:hypothetical protein
MLILSSSRRHYLGDKCQTLAMSQLIVILIHEILFQRKRYLSAHCSVTIVCGVAALLKSRPLIYFSMAETRYPTLVVELGHP